MESGTGIVPTMPINGYGDSFGGSGFWIIALIALLGLGNGGFGGRNLPNNIATNDYTTMVSAFNQLQNENTAIMNNSQRVATELQQALYNASYNNLNEVKTLEGNVATLGANMQECCCNTLRAIDGVNYNAALNTAAINANTTAQTQRVIDLIQENKIEALQNKIQSLELAQAMSGVVKYPTTTTYDGITNPFVKSTTTTGA